MLAGTSVYNPLARPYNIELLTYNSKWDGG